MTQSGMKLFVLHVPKTAGSSLFEVLKQHFGEANTCPMRYDDLNMIPRSELNDGYSLFFAHAYYAQLSLIDGPLFAATFLRDPLSRFISHLDFLRGQDRPDAYPVLLKRYTNREFVTNPKFRDLVMLLANDVTIRFSRAEIGTAPFPYPFDDAFEVARQNLNRMDFVGFSESFVSSTERLFNALSLVKAGDFDVQVNKREDGSLPHVEEELIDELEHICRYDLALYEEQLQRFNEAALGFSYRLKPMHWPLTESSGVPVLLNNADRGGLFAFGPYASLPRGLYELRYTVCSCTMSSSNDIGMGTLRFEVCTDMGRTIFAADDVKVAPGETLTDVVVVLPFSLRTATHGIEFRSYASRGLSVCHNADVLVTRRAGWRKAVPANSEVLTAR